MLERLRVSNATRCRTQKIKLSKSGLTKIKTKIFCVYVED